MYARVTTKGQITIPQKVRKALGLKKGSLVSFLVKDGRTEIVPVEEDVMALKGSVSVDAPQDYDAIETEVEKRVAEDAVQETQVRRHQRLPQVSDR